MALIQYVAKLAVDKDTGLPLPELQGQGGTIIARGNPSVIPTIYEDKDGSLAIPGSTLSVDGNGFVGSFWVSDADLPISWWSGDVEVPLESMEGVAKRITEVGTEATAAKDAAVAAQAAAEDAAALVDAPADDVVALLMQDDATDTGAVIEGMRPDGGGRPVGKGELVLHVRDYGAVGDGVTDDTAAIQAAFDAMKALSAGTFGGSPVLTASVTGHGGSYLVTGSLDLANMASVRAVEVRDMFIVAKVADKTVLDLSGSRSLRLTNVRIWGDQTVQAHTGILMSRTTTAPCKALYFDNVNVDGYYTSSALHLNAAEENMAHGCMFVNRRTADIDGESWSAILDGSGYKPIVSDYATPTTERESFTVNSFVKCTFQKPFSIDGPSVFMQDVASLTFSACYFTAGSGSAVVWRLTEFVPYRVVMDVQLETVGIARFIHFTADAETAREINGLDCTFGFVFCNQEMYSHDTVTALKLTSFRSHLYRLSGGLANGLFNPSTGVEVTGGDVVVPAASQFNLSDAQFEGTVSSNDSPTRIYGTSVAASGAESGARLSTVGSSNFVYTTRYRRASRIGGGAVHSLWRAGFVPTVGTGTGYLRTDLTHESAPGFVQSIPVANWYGFDLPTGYTAISMEIAPGVTYGRFKVSGPGLPLIDLDHTMLPDSVEVGYTFGGSYFTA